GRLRQRGAARYTKNVTEMNLFPCFGLFEGVGPCVWVAEIAQQLPNKSLRSNACNAAPGKTLAKCEKSQCLRHFGEHWLILWALSLTQNQGMFPVV
ncbi:MAG: hypothetical protein NT050_01210, partial [Verrucomicrobia bacterium]|nr:hypothetical protein [Verrucomicrobiota bacterium]